MLCSQLITPVQETVVSKNAEQITEQIVDGVCNATSIQSSTEGFENTQSPHKPSKTPSPSTPSAPLFLFAKLEQNNNILHDEMLVLSLESKMVWIWAEMTALILE